MTTYMRLVEQTVKEGVPEIFPWDLEERLEQGAKPLLLDIREPYEYAAMHMPGSINVPRGILEVASEYGFEETVPELAQAREREVVVICRSGYRSVLAARTMQLLGYQNVCSLKTGLRGWNDYEQPMADELGRAVELEFADEYFTPKLRPDQYPPA